MVDVARLPVHPLSALSRPALASSSSSPKHARRASLAGSGAPNGTASASHASPRLEYPAELQRFRTEAIAFELYAPEKGELDGPRYPPINGPAGGANGVNGTHGGAKSKAAYSYESAEPPAKRQRTDSAPSLPSSTGPVATTDLYTTPLNYRWGAADKGPRRAGLRNGGNSCFLNSVVQVWLHTPALVNVLEREEHAPGGLATVLKSYVQRSRAGQSFEPSLLLNNLKSIGPTLRKHRQEDAHEFLRYGIDKLQKDELARLGKQKAAHDIRETTWVHKIWGGRLRSRVRCSKGHDSDTFDTLLDLSLDLPRGATSLGQCLAEFTRVEELKGKNRYKCEKCKALVDATKQFKIVRAPPVLSMHLKRFNPMGGKIKREISYPAQIDIKSVVEPGTNHLYELYGVTVHQGSGPHFGHYYSFIKAPSGDWLEMNDDDVRRVHEREVLGQKDAYLLHYTVKPGAGLDDILRQPVANGKKQESKSLDSPASAKKLAKGSAANELFGAGPSKPVNGLPRRLSVPSSPAVPPPSTRTPGPIMIQRPDTPAFGLGAKRKLVADADESDSDLSGPSHMSPKTPSRSPSKRERQQMKKAAKFGKIASDQWYGIPHGGASRSDQTDPSSDPPAGNLPSSQEQGSPRVVASWGGGFDQAKRDAEQSAARIAAMRTKLTEINKKNKEKKERKAQKSGNQSPFSIGKIKGKSDINARKVFRG